MTAVLLLLTVLVGGCSKDKQQSPAFSFTQPVYFLTKQATLEITIYSSQPAGTDLHIPFTLGGSAVNGIDYELDQQEFVISAGTTSGAISIRPKDNVVEQREIRLELQPVTGYSFGQNKVAMIPIETQELITCSFDKDKYEIKTRTDINMLLYLGTRAYSRPSEEVAVPFIVDPASTAVEDEHYRFSTTEKVLIMGTASSRASIGVTPVKVEEGKNTLILRLAESNRYLPGLYNQVTITLAD